MFNSWIDGKDILKILYKTNQYFPKPYESYTGNVEVDLDLFDYVTKANLKRAAKVDTSNLAERSDLASLTAEVDKIDTDKRKTVPVDLSKLSNEVDNVVKKIVYDKLVTKVNAINSNAFVLKSQYNTDKLRLEKKINDAEKVLVILLDTSGLV